MTTRDAQKTIAKGVSFSGKALQTGGDAEVKCRPAPPDTGIIFSRSDLARRPGTRVGEMGFRCDNDRRSTIGPPGAEIQTIEHFLAALWALAIDNLYVDVRGREMPALDGSAIGFFNLIKNAGIRHQGARKRFIKITEPVEVKRGNSSIKALPDDGFAVSYLIDYDSSSIAKEKFNIRFDEGSFEKEIAPARTFCLKSEAEALLKAGLGGGASLENTLVMDDDGPVGATLRFPNEPVRHKVLDLVGDLYLLGAPVIGRIEAERSGHSLNLEMVRALHERYVK